MSDWPKVPLGDVLTETRNAETVDRQRSYPNFGIYSFGRGAFAKPSIDGMQTSASTLYRAKRDQFVYSRLFAFEGAYALVPDELDGAYVSNEFPLFDCDAARLDPRFLRYWICRKPIWTAIAESSTGMGSRRQRVQPEYLLKHQMPLPLLAEQQRIVARIEAVATRANEARSARAEAQVAADAIVLSALRATFGNEPKPDWRPLSAFVTDIYNGWSPQCESRRASASEWGVLKVGAVSFGTFDENEQKALPPGLAAMPELEIKAGDFLMSRANTTQLVGACAHVVTTRSKLMLCDKIFRFKFCDENVNRAYWSLLMKSPAVRLQIERAASGTSSTMKNISKPKILALKFPSHSVDEQRRIFGWIEGLMAKVDAAHRFASDSAAALDALLPSVLDRAFKGRL